MGKSGPNATFNLIFLGLGWPWVGEFDGFITITSICFPTQQNLVPGISQTPYWRKFLLSHQVYIYRSTASALAGMQLCDVEYIE